MTSGPDIHVYKMVADNGGAPCVHRNLLSLAICKPRIRKSAQVGALVFGFGGKAYGERLLYVAKVTQKLLGPDYYCEPEYCARPDCIYRNRGGKAEIKPGARYHGDGNSLQRDVGRGFESAHVLLSDDFRYFGGAGTDDYKSRYPALKRLIEGLTQGHRRNHAADVRRELMQLKDQLLVTHDSRKRHKPTEADRTKACNDETPSRVC